MARLARVELALAFDLVEKDEVRDFLVGYGPIFHRSEVHDLPIHDEVAFLIHIVFTVLIAGDLCFKSEVLKGRLYLMLTVKVKLLLAGLTLQFDRRACGCWLGQSLVGGYVDRILLRYEVV